MTNQEPASRFRFSLRSLFVVTAVVACIASIAHLVPMFLALFAAYMVAVSIMFSPPGDDD